MAELHLTGSPPLLEAAMELILQHGARPARQGEFTMRAFLAGRIDLTQAEAVLGVIEAEDHQRLGTALRQLAGGLSGRMHQLKHELVNLLADLEAGLDFVDEDIEFVSQAELTRRLEHVLVQIQQLYAQTHQRMRSTGRRRVLLAGLPNAGKSTLFNALTESGQALTSDLAGTTRDWLSSPVDRDSIPVDLIDSAGREDGPRGPSREAQSGLQEQLALADLVVWCSAFDNDEGRIEEDSAGRRAVERDSTVIRALTKSDLRHSREPARSGAGQEQTKAHVEVSAETGEGLERLWSVITAHLADESANELVGSTASRGRDSLRRAMDSLCQAVEAARSSAGDELIAIEIHDALRSLGEVTGETVTDDILDRVFSRFCIGK